MHVVVHDFHTEIFPTNEEVKRLCRPGAGADTCIWLLMGAKGWECSYHNKPGGLVDRWLAGKTTAKRDGCDDVRHLKLSELGATEQFIEKSAEQEARDMLERMGVAEAQRMSSGDLVELANLNVFATHTVIGFLREDASEQNPTSAGTVKGKNESK